MIISIIETLLGLILLNTSLKSLKKSIIRRWREGFAIILVTSILMIIHGLLSSFISFSPEINSYFLLIFMAANTVSFLRISGMKGLQA
ncbi:MAG: hypothetical protein JW791_02880 [Nanoarchaeota archaeon]|nr:hypothetical protein [Nanoarchaeota archaeon]